MNHLKYNNSKNGIHYDSSKYISIEVLSSKDRVRICVDDATVILRHKLDFYLTYIIICEYAG